MSDTIIRDIKVWKQSPGRPAETRVYVHTTDGREGCLYCTGNPWHAKGSKDGNLTAEEWREAAKIANQYSPTGNTWTTVYENQLHPAEATKTKTTKSAEAKIATDNRQYEYLVRRFGRDIADKTMRDMMEE